MLILARPGFILGYVRTGIRIEMDLGPRTQKKVWKLETCGQELAFISVSKPCLLNFDQKSHQTDVILAHLAQRLIDCHDICAILNPE